MTTDGDGWIVFQRRVDQSVDFSRDLDEFKAGFGDVNGNFWLGLERLHKLAAPGKNAVLRVDLKHFNYPGIEKYAQYSIFAISNEDQGYKITVGGYSGTAGDSLNYHNGMKFTTKDKDQDLRSGENCAQIKKGAWWHYTCLHSSLNSLYPTSGVNNNDYMTWYHFDESGGGIIFSEMKFKYS